MVQLSANSALRIKDINRLLLKRETTFTKICEESLRLIDQTSNLNSFITVCRDNALKRAHELDSELRACNKESADRLLMSNPLCGIPISIKDNFCTNGTLTTCASKMLHNYLPPYSATTVSKLQQANCIMMGKTNMDEFAMGSSSTTSFYGPTANWWKSNELLNGQRPDSNNPSQWYMAGGSSTGSAVSVASGSCFASLGTDTGGSTRQPASLTGIVGYKPTYGLISRFGLVPLAHCLDVVSIFARNVDDVELVFNAVIGEDENDLTSVDHREQLISSETIDSICRSDKGDANKKITIRIGVPDEFIMNGDMSEEVSANFDKFLKYLVSNSRYEIGDGKTATIEFQIQKLHLPHSSLATECYTVISSAEIASNMSCYDGVKFGYSSKSFMESQPFDRDAFFKANRDEGFGAEVKKRILLGNYFLLSENRDRYLMQALRLRRLINDEYTKAFLSGTTNNVDIILTPSTSSPAVTHEEWLRKQDDNKLFREDYFLIPANLANLPAINLPAGSSRTGLPFGLQLIGNKFHDLGLLAMSKVFELMISKGF